MTEVSMSLEPIIAGVGGVLFGFVVHNAVFIHGEWHLHAPELLVFHLGGFLLLVIFRGSSHVVDVLGLTVCGYITGLFLSIVVYRVFFHPLTRQGFQGPIWMRVTKLWHVWKCRTARNHLVLDPLQKKYGDFVRTGPAEVTVFHPDVFMAIEGPRTECIKAEWYDLLSPGMALVTAREKATHAARRREWTHGFTTKALAAHEAKILKYVDQLDQCIDAKQGSEVDVRDLFFWFGFDAMGEFVFSKSFDMLRDSQWHFLVVRLQSAMSLLGYVSPAPWLFQIGFKLGPRVSILKDWFDMTAWCEDQMKDRLGKNAEKSSLDLAHYLMESDPEGMDQRRWSWLKGDSLLAIVAGSEPTAVALIGAFCELAKHRHHASQIYDELKDVHDTDLKALTAMPHLNAVINETLRLYPALLTGGVRKTTENGVTIGGTFIPPYTTIVAPRYSISRRSDCFERPSEFIPERWTTTSEMVLNKAAFAPFGTGHHSCIGKFLALDIMRYVIARLVKKYTFHLAPGETGLAVMGDMKDQFASNPGKLRLCFEVR